MPRRRDVDEDDFEVRHICPACEGSGVRASRATDPHSSLVTCTTCTGSGNVTDRVFRRWQSRHRPPTPSPGDRKQP